MAFHRLFPKASACTTFNPRTKRQKNWGFNVIFGGLEQSPLFFLKAMGIWYIFIVWFLSFFSKLITACTAHLYLELLSLAGFQDF